MLSHVVPIVHLFFFHLKRPKSFVGAFGVSTNDQDNVASGNEFHASAVTALRIACLKLRQLMFVIFKLVMLIRSYLFYMPN